jgi:uncharacterized membrane protein YidH (DUF202 family)
MSDRTQRVLVARRLRLPLVIGLLLVPTLAYAHVKWFSQFTYADRPRTLREVATPTFLALATLSTVVVGGLAFADDWLRSLALAKRIEAWLERYRSESLVVLRVGAGATMLMAWQAGTLLAPELPVVHGALGWAQFGVVLLLLIPQTVPVAGVLLGALWLYAAFSFGLFHLLDYTFFPGIAFAFAVSRLENEKIRGLSLPALYFTVGFSLIWVALEKLVYPEWALYVLSQHRVLAMGLTLDFFLIGAAFVELSLGHLLILGLLGRTLALTITVVFLITSSVFGGKLEVMGHTPVHAALIVFILEGAGHRYRPPFLAPRRIPHRALLSAGSFLAILAVLLVAYQAGAHHKYEEAIHGQLGPADRARPVDSVPPTTPTHDHGDHPHAH